MERERLGFSNAQWHLKVNVCADRKKGQDFTGRRGEI